MKRLYPVLLVVLMMLWGCETAPTVILPEGPAATQLSSAKDEQIKGLVAQVKAEQDARALANQQASLAAADFDTILFAAQHVDVGLPRDAIEAEAKLGIHRLPPSDPAEIIKGKDRVIAILQGEVAKAKGLYDEAHGEATKAKDTIAAKDKDIADRDTLIKDRDTSIVKLTADAKAERIAHAKDVQTRISQLEDEAAQKEQKTLMLWLGLGGIGLILGGVILIAISQGHMLVQGIMLSVGGALIILLRLGYLTLVAQTWFPYAAGVVAAAILVAIGWSIWHLWVQNKLHLKTVSAIQDMKDEAAATGDTKGVDQLNANLKYRLGDSTSFWGSRQLGTVVAAGLVDLKGEAALKTATAIPTVPPVAPPQS